MDPNGCRKKPEDCWFQHKIVSKSDFEKLPKPNKRKDSPAAKKHPNGSRTPSPGGGKGGGGKGRGKGKSGSRSPGGTPKNTKKGYDKNGKQLDCNYELRKGAGQCTQQGCPYRHHKAGADYDAAKKRYDAAVAKYKSAKGGGKQK